MLQSQNFELDVNVHGSKARVYKHEGRCYIEGRVGSEFTVSIKNNTPQRVLAVLTVDGLSVMDGKEGSFKSGGYILPAWGSVKVPGWRLNNKEVASFEFTYPGNSYASSKGKGNNLGVVGCAFYYEKYVPPTSFTYTFIKDADTTDAPWPKRPYPNIKYFGKDKLVGDFPDHSQFQCSAGSSTINAFNATLSSNTMSAANLSSQGLGTGFGDKQSHKVNEVEFVPASESPAEIVTVYYDTRDGLKRRGVDIDYHPEVAPNPFPLEPSSYCEPPKDWNG